MPAQNRDNPRGRSRSGLLLPQHVVQLPVHILHAWLVASHQYLALNAGVQAPVDFIDQ